MGETCVTATSLEQALALLAQHGQDAACHQLIAMRAWVTLQSQAHGKREFPVDAFMLSVRHTALELDDMRTCTDCTPPSLKRALSLVASALRASS
jgi:CO/xanthine dehydrogenase FAD-binding subunit